MDWFAIALRILHIGTGLFWVGAAYTFFWFIEPTAKALGADASRFMEEVTVKRRFPIVITVGAALAILSGLALYWRDSGGLRLEWITSPTGLGFTVGGLAAIIAFAIGLVFIKPNVDRLGALGGLLQAEKRPPNAEEADELERIDGIMRRAGIADMVLLTVAVVAMASARYLG